MEIRYRNHVMGGSDRLPIIQISYADYQKLSGAEKKEDVIYLVEDAPNVIPSAWERYSTDEIPIGTWIDGRTIYRKTMTGTLPTTTETAIPGTKISDVDTIVKFDACAILKTGNITQLPLISDGRWAFLIWMSQDKSLWLNATDTAVSGSKYVATLEYVKEEES